MQVKCTKCGDDKSFPTDFFADARLRRGYRSCCKLCDQAYPRDFRQYRGKYGPRPPRTGEQRRREASAAREKYALVGKNPEYRERKRIADVRYRRSRRGRLAQKRAKYRRRAADAVHDITAEEWSATIKAFSTQCAYCAYPLTDDTITRDHFLPLSKGGGTTYRNLVPSCRPCNSSKGAKEPIGWCTEEAYSRITKILERLP